MPHLVRPTVVLRAKWLDAHDEWGEGLHEDGFGLRTADDVRSPHGFEAFVDRLSAAEAACGDAGCTYRWIVEDGQVLGGIALRHSSNPAVTTLGHVGYGLRPSARGRRVAALALQQMLGVARLRGMERVQLCCLMDNTASIRTIERCGGVLDHQIETAHGKIGRFSVSL
ncbi:GNAT family N-acetyltransferase [Arthrobacter sp. NPDC080082]|uniref:GNAT family N-acetyltransferase n=1 Tax=Arthrobacter sp. NPDC080082 TaxID=3155916 RepID=UPI0034460C63